MTTTLSPPDLSRQTRTSVATRSHQTFRNVRALIWALGLFPLPALLALFRPTLWPYGVPLALYLGFCAGVLAHYHNHRPVFRSKLLNALYANWLGIFYGFPLFGWIPTHNQNHHKFVNAEGDATRTTKVGKDSLLAALSYPTRSSRWQLPALVQFVAAARKKRGYRSVEPFVQSTTIIVAHSTLAVLLVERSGWPQGGVAYLTLVLLPAVFSSWSMMFTNYLQHVGCDANSADNHSRNFVGRWENWFVFDAGLHTVHHEHPGVHFSEYRALHDARVERIDPKLNERNMFSFLLKRYLLRVGTEK